MLVIFFLFCQVTNVFAVGAFFVPKADGSQVTMLGARAFVYRNGMKEDLILQVGFSGDATDFAWVIPVPAQPQVKTADPVIFDELYSILNPLILPPNGSSNSATQKRAKLLPIKPVSVRDVKVIPPIEQGALAKWLSDNHYEAPSAAYDLLTDYYKRGWYYIVVRIRTSKQDGSRWIEPLRITFDSQRASVPARLSTLNSKPFVTQIYVAADVPVKAAGFTEAHSTDSPPRSKFKMIEFPTFFSIVNRDCKLTELLAQLTPQNITSDIVVMPR
jgi:hypothetical protein